MIDKRTLTLVPLTFLLVVLSIPLSTWQNANRSFAKIYSPLSWHPEPREPAAAHFIHNSVHHEHVGSKAWDLMLPPYSDAHLVYVKNDDGTVSTHTVTMFHQLRCIEILHRAYAERATHQPSELAQHCLNYLRQSIMCQSDTNNEPQGGSITQTGSETLCKDWEPVFAEAERNRKVHKELNPQGGL